MVRIFVFIILQTDKNLCDACSSDEECSSIGATCVNGSCECASNQFTDECGICNLSKNISISILYPFYKVSIPNQMIQRDRPKFVFMLISRLWII